MDVSTFLALIACVLTILATYLLASQRYVWDAFFLLGWAIFAYGLIFYRTLATVSRHKLSLKRFLPRTWIGWVRLIASGLSLWVAYVARNKLQNEDFTFLLTVWLFALCIFILSLIIPWLATHPHFKFSKYEIITLSLLLLLAFFLRGVLLSRVPANLSGDEGTQLLAALQLLEHPLGNPFATGWYSVPTMSFFLYGAAMRIFGASIMGGRMLSVLAGTLTILGTFLLADEMGGRKVAWVAALVMTFSAYHIHFSRLASNQIFDPLIGTFTLWLLWRALRINSTVKVPRPRRRTVGGTPWIEHFNGRFSVAQLVTQVSNPILAKQTESFVCWGGVGLTAGLGWYAYFGARWMTLLIAGIVCWRFLFERDLLKRHWRGLLLCVFAWLLVTLPLWGWYSRYPSPLTERYNAVSIFASGWVAREQATTGKTVTQLLLQQFWKSITAFHLTHDPTFWYFPERPLLDFVTAALMLIGIVATFVQWRDFARSTTLLWFFATLVMAWTLTENPPSSQRGLLLMPSVALLVAWGIVSLEHVFSKWYDVFSQVLVALLAVIIVLNLGFYFRIYTPRRLYGNPTSETATELAHFILEYPFPACVSSATCVASPIYFYGAPELYWDFGTLAFLLREQRGINVLPEQDMPPIMLPARFIFTPMRSEDMSKIQTSYPTGQLYQLTAQNGRVMAYIYDVP